MQFSSVALMDDADGHKVSVGGEAHKGERPVERNPILNLQTLAIHPKLRANIGQDAITRQGPEKLPFVGQFPVDGVGDLAGLDIDKSRTNDADGRP
jgi:hypothetical protein